MDINKIHYFFSAAETQNFTRAAEYCHIAQTTMSKYISVLEQELGFKLFVRSNKTARLTEQGEAFYDGMKKIAEQYTELCRQISKRDSRELRIGMMATDYEDFPILRSFELENPDVSVYYSFAENEKLLEELRKNKLDALICPSVLTLGGFDTDGFVREDMVMIEEALVCSRELIERYGSIGNVIANRPLITKTAESAYQNFCREKLGELYGSVFNDVIVAENYSQQILLLNLSRGFAIIPAKMGMDYDNLVFTPADEILYESAQLIYHGSFISSALGTLLKYVHEKKC